ncbi:MAG: hypothetical protein ACXWEG_04430 [Actinomycetota bacterium]
MTEGAKQAWGEVGEKFSSWGRRVADRYQEAGSTEKADADEAERELKRAMKDLFDELSRGVSAVGATLKDDQAKKELTDAVSAIGDAITATVNEATEAIRSKGSSTPPPPAPPPPTGE